ncbi:MAG: MerR family transcriptional regulator [Alphaproteobacteria bacterium]|nr:MerR family transcriptional regulator [Alphaproteobacteria bacterium]
MLSSKELMEKTGVSRATLNNYIGLGLIPKPVVKHPDSADSKARRLGYFPASAVSKVDKIRRLKRDGMRMPEIVEKLTSDGAPAAAPTPAIEMAPVLAPVQAQSAVPIVAQDNSPTVNEPRDPSPSDLPGRDPRLAELSVLATELEHADKIRAELPPEEYFELINRILADLEPLSRSDAGNRVFSGPCH